MGSARHLSEPLQQTLRIFDAGELWTTTEVAERLDLERRTAYARLDRLVEADHLNTKKVGASGRVWWRPLTLSEDRAADSVQAAQSEQGIQLEQQFRSLVEATDEYAIFLLDDDGYVQSWNPGAERIKGYTAEDIVGSHFSVFYTDSDRAADIPGTNLKTAAQEGSIQDEGWRVRKDGARFWANVTITAIRDANGEIAGYAKVTRDMTERREHEQQLQAEKAFVESVLDTQPDILYAVDNAGEFLRWNDRFSEMTGYTDTEIEQMHLVDFIADRAADEATAAIEQVFENEVDITVELPLVTADGEEIPYEFTGGTLTNEAGEVVGLTGIGRNISERKAKERQLKRQRNDFEEELSEMFERIDKAFISLDSEWRLTYANDQAADLLQVSVSELLQAQAWDVFADVTEEFPREKIKHAVQTQVAVEFELYSEILDRWLELRGYPSETGISVYISDITERKEREQELTRFRRAVEAAGHSIYMTDPAGILTYVNPAFEEMTGYSRDEALGQTPDILDSGEHGDKYFDRLWETITAGERWEEEIVNRRKDGELYTAHQIITPVSEGEDIDQFVAIQTDITDRKEYERKLERQIHQQEVVTDLGRRALEYREIDALMADAAELVADTLDTDYCKVLDLDPEAEEFLLRQGVGWNEGIVGEAAVSSVADDSQAAHTLTTEHPIVVESLDTESRFSGPDILTDHDVTSGISVVIGPHTDPWGILGAHDTARREFTEQDVSFVQSVAHILASAINRHQDEQELVRQREELATLNNLNTIVSEITDTIIGKSTREEIEQTVCDALATSDSYQFAWLADIDKQTETFDPRVTAGTDGYAENITISLDPNNPESQGPGATAIREQETQVVQDVFSDPDFEPWRDAAAEYGFSSLASIPILYEGTVYGVLGVYADRANAFGTAERTLISRLGEVVGHAIASLERKHALLGEEVVELTFQVRDAFEELDIPGDSTGTIRLTEVVPLQEDEFLVYGTATADARESMERIQASLSRWEEVSFYTANGDTRFELHLSEHPVLSVLASLGGSLEEATIEDGDYQLTIHVAPSTDVRRLIDTVQESYPNVEMVTRRQTNRTDRHSESSDDIVAELTDRQRATIRAAYHSGFFEWPRDSSGKDVADSLGVAPPTFHHHLRKAEKQIVDSALSVNEE